MQYKIRFPKRTADLLALLGFGAALGGGIAYVDYNNYLNKELRYASANVQTVPNVSSVGWLNFTNEGGGTADDWAFHIKKLEELNGGRDITKLGPNEPIKLFDLPDYKTGKPDGTVLPVKKQ